MPKPRTIVKGRRIAYRGRYVRMGARGVYRRQRFNPLPTFTETADFGSQVVPGIGTPFLGQLACTLNSIPQFAQYRALYNQARILRVQYILMPNFTEFAPQGSITSATQSVTAPRLVYSIQDSSDVAPPVSELDILADNGSKIRMFNKPIKISCRPVASLQQTIPSGGVASVSRKRVWLSTTDGAGVTHVGVNYAVVQDSLNTANNQALFNVYAKITFQLRDPK